MSPRFLSLLSLIEQALAAHERLPASPTRLADYRRGVARLAFADGGVIALQNFLLADGQLCVRVDLARAPGVAPLSVAIYPRQPADWPAGAERVADEWSRLPAAADPAATEDAGASAAPPEPMLSSA